ncbi:hypothetical protein FRC06_002750 [Ceratobasidium sp. 370]|nr:hypothetical protein FRC06_002750 [Ceratobasidium sp. 370]
MLAEDLGQPNAATVLRDWDSKNPPIDESMLASTSSIVGTPNNLKAKRSLESFLPRRRNGSLLNRLFPRRSRSSASIPHLNIGDENQESLRSRNSSITLGTEASQLDHGDCASVSPHSGRPYQDDSRGSSSLSLGSSLGLTRTLEPRSAAATWDESKDRSRTLPGSPIREDWGARIGTTDRAKRVVLAHERKTAAETGLEASGANLLAGEGSLRPHCKANELPLDILYQISEDQPLEIPDVVREDNSNTGDDNDEHSALREHDVVPDSAWPPSANLRPSTTISKFMAPELLHGATYSIPADVYALGMTILETITGTVPFSGRNNIAVLAAVMTRKTPARPEDDIPSNSQHGDILWSLLKKCWNPEPAERPSAAQVAEVMRGINKQGLERTPMEERDL